MQIRAIRVRLIINLQLMFQLMVINVKILFLRPFSSNILFVLIRPICVHQSIIQPIHSRLSPF